MSKQFGPFAFVFLVLVPALSLAGGELPLFASDEILEISLRADIKGLIDSREVRTQNLRPAVISYRGSTGDMVSQNVSVDVRGNSKRSFCRFPPLLMEFDKRNSEHGVFQGIKETKIATHCDPKLKERDGLTADSEANVIQEYMIYKLYNLYTDASLKVRLARIRYEDVNSSVEPISRLAFFLEDAGDAARRLGWKREKDLPVTYSDFEPRAFARTLMFSMMVGHGDWRIHETGQPYNSKAYRDSLGNLNLILYDFDLSQMMGDGSVETPIRIVGPGLIHWGPDATASMFKRSEDEFAQLKRETTQIKDKFVCLNDEEIKSLLKFVYSFQIRAAKVFENPLVPAKQRAHSKRVFDELFELLRQNKLDLSILKSACVR